METINSAVQVIISYICMVLPKVISPVRHKKATQVTEFKTIKRKLKAWSVWSYTWNGGMRPLVRLEMT